MTTRYNAGLIGLLAVSATACSDRSISAEMTNRASTELVRVWTDSYNEPRFESGPIEVATGEVYSFDPDCVGEWCSVHVELANGSKYSELAYVDPPFLENKARMEVAVVDDGLKVDVLWEPF